MLQIQIPTIKTNNDNTKYPTSPNWNEKLSFKSLAKMTMMKKLDFSFLENITHKKFEKKRREEEKVKKKAKIFCFIDCKFLNRFNYKVKRS